MGVYERNLRNALPGRRGWGDPPPPPTTPEAIPFVYTTPFPWQHVPEHVRRGHSYRPVGNISPGVGSPVSVKQTGYVLLGRGNTNRLCIVPQSPGASQNRISWDHSKLPPEWEFHSREVDPPLSYSRSTFRTFEARVNTSVPGGPHGFHFLMGVVSMAPKKRFPRTWGLLKSRWEGQISLALEAYQKVETYVDANKGPSRRKTVLCPLTGALGMSTGTTPGGVEMLPTWRELGNLHETSLGELLPFTKSVVPTEENRMMRYRLGEGDAPHMCLNLRIPLQHWKQFYASVKVGQYCAFPYPTLGHSPFQHGDYANACAGVDILVSGLRGPSLKVGGVLKKIGGCYVCLAQSHNLTSGHTSNHGGSWPETFRQLPKRWWGCLAKINRGMPVSCVSDPDVISRGGTDLNGMALSRIRGLPSLVVVGENTFLADTPPPREHFWLWPRAISHGRTTCAISWEGSNVLPRGLPVAPLETQRRVS